MQDYATKFGALVDGNRTRPLPWKDPDEASATPGQQGSQGAQGGEGSQGPQGNQGAAGDQGNQGAPGTQGDQGGTGAQGQQGDQGAPGTGDQGPQGFQGDAGSQGPQGFQGDVGAQGGTGSQGPQGDKGAILFGRGHDEIVRVVCPEMPETWLMDVVRIRGVRATVDPIFMSVIEPGSLVAMGTGVRVSGNSVEADAPCYALIGGIRKGFDGRRFVRQTPSQMSRSVRFWSEQYA